MQFFSVGMKNACFVIKRQLVHNLIFKTKWSWKENNKIRYLFQQKYYVWNSNFFNLFINIIIIIIFFIIFIIIIILLILFIHSFIHSFNLFIYLFINLI